MPVHRRRNERQLSRRSRRRFLSRGTAARISELGYSSDAALITDRNQAAIDPHVEEREVPARQ